MERPAGNVIPEIVQEHCDTYRFLWGQHQAALRSPDFTLRDLSRLEERMDAHLDGLLLAGKHAVALVEESLTGDDHAAALAAAYTLLAMDRDEASVKVADAFSQAKGPALDGLRDALCLGNVTRMLPMLRELFASSSAPLAVAAAEVLAFHGHLDANAGRLAGFLTDEDPAVRAEAWRVAAILDSSGGRRR